MNRLNPNDPNIAHPKALEAATEMLLGMHPDKTIELADPETAPPGYNEFAEQLMAALDQCLEDGECFDCGATVPAENLVPDDEGVRTLPDDWAAIFDPISGQMTQIMCPACTKVMQEHSTQMEDGQFANAADGPKMLKAYKERKAARN